MAEQGKDHDMDPAAPLPGQEDLAGQAGGADSAEGPDAGSPEALLEAARARNEELEAEVAALKDRAMRAMAEADNLRKRTEREKEDMRKFALSGFARDLLTVSDNLRRALDAVPADQVESNDGMKSLVDGVEMTERELLAIFERNGIVRVDPLDQPFDHNYHQAIQEMEDPSRPNGTVIQVLQSGYVQHERLLRPAMVIVSRGGPRGKDGVDTVA